MIRMDGPCWSWPHLRFVFGDVTVQLCNEVCVQVVQALCHHFTDARNKEQVLQLFQKRVSLWEQVCDVMLGTYSSYWILLLQDVSGEYILKRCQEWADDDFMNSVIGTFRPFVGDSSQVADGADRVWLYILQHTDDKYVKGLQAVLDRYARHISVLANVQAPNGYSHWNWHL